MQICEEGVEFVQCTLKPALNDLMVRSLGINHIIAPSI